MASEEDHMAYDRAMERHAAYHDKKNAERRLDTAISLHNKLKGYRDLHDKLERKEPADKDQPQM
jgi:hypothetical protein